MDEYMNRSESSAPQMDTDSSTAEDEKQPKRYTLKSARTALRRMEADLDKKTEQIAGLKKEIAELKPKIRAMSALIEQLQKAETEKKVHDAFRMKSKHMTSNQVLIALNLVQQLAGDLDDMDIDELASMIRAKASDKKKGQETKTVDTSSNFPFQTNEKIGE